MTQATTSDTTIAERPEMDSAPEAETADTIETSTEPSSEDDSVDLGVDVASLPPDQQEYAKNLEKQFKSAYTRKRQEESARLKHADYEREALRKQVEQYQTQWKAVLDDPSKFEAYRQLYGNPPKKAEEPQHFDTVQDLVGHFENKVKSLQEQLEQKIQEGVNSRLSSYSIEARWDKTEETRAATDPVYAQYRSLVHKEIKSNPEYYQKMYVGTNENAILDIALKNVMSAVNPILNGVKQKAQQTIEKKKSASTLAPARSQGESKSVDDRDAIIQEIQAKYGRLDMGS